MADKLENKVAVKSIAKLYLQSKSADVHFALTTDDVTVKIPAHKAILAAASPVFDAMFYGELKENYVVEIVDASASAFEEFLQFFYLSEVTISMKNIDEVVRLADKYDMIECVNACVIILGSKLSKKNAICGYQLAIALNNQPAKELCENHIKIFTNDVIKSEQFCHCDKSVLENILRLEPLCCKELDLFTACFEWAESSSEANGLDGNDPKILRNQLDDLFHLIRFGTMTIDEIALIMSDEQKRWMFSQDETADLFCMKLNKDFQSKTFKTMKQTQRSNHWNSEKVLKCELKTDSSYIVTQSIESTWFSVNFPILLGLISWDYIIDSYSRVPVNISSKMSIVEHEQQTFPVANASTILHKTEVDITTEKLSYVVPYPIVLNPERMYEIRFEIPTVGNKRAHHPISKSDAKLDEDVTIKFHVNPTEFASGRRGLVSCLSFNRI